MVLTRQKTYTHSELFPLFEGMFQRKSERLNLFPNPEPDFPSHDWFLIAYTDGPLTFFVANSPTGIDFTGYSKFDYEGQWNEMTGLCKAMQRALDKYFENLRLSKETEVQKAEQILNNVAKNQPLAPPGWKLVKIGETSEVHTEQDSVSSR